MTDTTFTQGTIIEPTWLQDANDHVNDKTGIKHAASKISNTPAGNISATTVQAAIDELDYAINTKSTNYFHNPEMSVQQRPALTPTSSRQIGQVDRWAYQAVMEILQEPQTVLVELL